MMIFTGILLCIFLPVLNAIDTEVYVQELNSQNFAVCHNKRKFSCPDSNSSLKLRIKSCGFKCEPGTTYVCKNDKGGRGVLEFCFEPQICEKGQMNKVFFDDEHQQIVIQKSVCPDGFFQPVRDDCFKACTDFKHEDPGLISYWGIKVLYSGNNTHPGRGYCDVDNGFVSSDTSKMYTSLAHNEVSVCDKLDTFKSICGPGKRLLPNRQCGNICRKGYVVDRWNYFKCSMGSHNSSTVTEETTAHPDQNVTPSPPEISKHINITSPSTPSTSPHQKGTQKGKDGSGARLTTLLVAVFVPTVVVIVLIVSGCYIYWRCKNSSKRDQSTIDREPSASRRSIRINKNYGCRYTKTKTKNGDIIINNIIIGDKEEISVTRNSSTADTGVSTSNISAVESDEEQDHVSIESGYRTAHADESLPQQVMNILKSVGRTCRTDEDIEQTEPMKIAD